MYDNRMFVFGVECDPKTKTVKQNEFIIMECKISEDQIGLFDLDDRRGITVANMFLEKMQNS